MNYELLEKQVESLINEESDLILIMSNVSALLKQELENTNWVGFYRVENNELILGPFQGKVACGHISFDQGVCGYCYREDKIVRVNNVHDFPSHIACDSDSNSEIVLPIHNSKGEISFLLDIDSPILNRFTKDDEEGLANIVKILETKIK